MADAASAERLADPGQTVGDGHIDFAKLTRSVAAAGYAGDVEVEIFSADVWAAPGDEVVSTLARRYVELVQPHL